MSKAPPRHPTPFEPNSDKHTRYNCSRRARHSVFSSSNATSKTVPVLTSQLRLNEAIRLCGEACWTGFRTCSLGFVRSGLDGVVSVRPFLHTSLFSLSLLYLTFSPAYCVCAPYVLCVVLLESSVMSLLHSVHSILQCDFGPEEILRLKRPMKGNRFAQCKTFLRRKCIVNININYRAASRQQRCETRSCRSFRHSENRNFDRLGAPRGVPVTTLTRVQLTLQANLHHLRHFVFVFLFQ